MQLLRNNKLDVLVNFVIVFIVVSLILISMLSVYGSTVVFALEESVYFHGDINSNYVSLMFNVYWGEEYLDEILKVFESYNVKTTFFVGGSWADDHYEYVKKIFEKGHEIGNHGYFHKNQSKLSYEENVREIKSNNLVIKGLCGIDMNLFAPPSGDYSKDTIKAAENLDMKVIMWSVDTIDWRDHNDSLILSRAKKAKGGDLVLMHPTKNTLNILPQLIEYYQNNSIEIVPVSKNINALV